MTPTAFRKSAFPPDRKSRHGFTLIELLVVIAIISLLVSILLPSLQKAKELAQGVACQANLRGMLTALQFYANDHDNLIPPYSVGDYSVATFEYRKGGTQWYMKLGYTGYIESDVSLSGNNQAPYNIDPISLCPSWAPDDPGNVNSKSYRYGYRNFWRWEVAGMSAYPEDVPGGQYDFHSIDRISDHSPLSEFFILADSASKKLNGFQTHVIFWDQYLNSSIKAGAHARHADKANTAFLDGHVETKTTSYFNEMDMNPNQYGFTKNSSGTTRPYVGLEQDLSHYTD